MRNPFGKYADRFYALMRIVLGLLFLCHGAQKLISMFQGTLAPAPLMIAAGLIELICGSLVAVGLWASFAAFIASGQMAVAYFMMHLPRGFLPINNGGELAVLYCFAFLYIAARGSGPFALK